MGSLHLSSIGSEGKKGLGGGAVVACKATGLLPYTVENMKLGDEEGCECVDVPEILGIGLLNCVWRLIVFAARAVGSKGPRSIENRRITRTLRK